MSFFRILFSVCFGTSLFTELKKQTLGRAVWHLCLLAFLCTVFIGIAVYFIHCREIRAVAGRFFEHTGDIVVGANEISLEKNPDESRSYLLSSHFRFDYIAKESDIGMVTPGKWTENGGIICFRSLLALWLKEPRPDSRSFRLIYLPVSVLHQVVSKSGEKQKKAMELISRDNSRTYTAQELTKKLQTALADYPVPAKKDSDPEDILDKLSIEISEDNAVPVICGAFVLSALTAVSMGMTFLLFFTVVIISLFLCMRNKREADPLPRKQLFVVTMYTAFPPLIIYSIFQIVSLPAWLSPEFLFFAAFFIYQIFVLRTVYGTDKPGIPEP